MTLPLLAIACGDDPSSLCDRIKPGLWRAKYTLRAGSDSSCNQIPDRTIVFGDANLSAGPSCDEGCTCNRNADDVACTLDVEQICDDWDQHCTYDFTSTTTARAFCDANIGEVSCAVDITIAWEADAP